MIEKLREGDEEAFSDFVERHTTEVYRLLLRLVSDTEEAKDLTQEVFIRAVRSIKEFRGESDLRTWLFRIAVNASRNRFRWWGARGRDRTVSIESASGESDRVLGDTIPSGSISPEEEVLIRERRALLFRALGEIARDYREAVVLADLHGLKYEEISTLLGVNIGTVKSRIARGRSELRKRLEGI